MSRVLLSLFVALFVALLVCDSAEAQLFRVRKSVAAQDCASGQCIQRAANVVTAPLRAVAQNRGSYPSVSSSVGYGSSGSVVSGGGSSGSLAVGSRLADGSIVTSVGVTVAQPIVAGVCDCCCADCKCNKSDGPMMAGAMGDSIRARRSFKRNVLEAAKQAVDAGDMSQEQYRQLSFALKIPRIAAEMESAMASQAAEDGVVSGPMQNIDWEKLMEFIVKWLPIILKLFAVSDVQPAIINAQPFVLNEFVFDWYS